MEIQQDRNYMARALKLAENGVGKTAPNPLVGAVVVKDGRIIGEGWHERFGQAHAEVNAVNHAEKAAGSVADATIYVNLEPCCHYGKTPPCTELLIAKKLKRVVIGTLDPNKEVAGKGAERLRNAGIQVTAGVLEDESKELNEVFLHYIQTRMPFVVLKAAVSLDGKIAAYSGKSKWITGEFARSEVHGLRNRYTAVMAGVGTVITDDPELTCRMEGGRNPVRILLDSKLRIPINSKVLADPERNPAIIACAEGASRERALELESLGAKVLFCSSRDGQVDLTDLAIKLGDLNIDSVLLEGGGTVNESALAQGVVSKLLLYIAPIIIGGEQSKTFVEGMGVENPGEAYPMQFASVETLGEDIKITAYPKRKEKINCLQEL